MRYKKKLIVLFIVVLVLTGLQALLPYSPATVAAYDRYVFHPFQFARNIVFGYIPLSIGDILYIVGGVAILVSLVRLVYFIVKFRTHKHYLLHWVLQAMMVLGIVYIVFFIGWGGNYYKPSLTTYWDLDKTDWSADEELIAFDKYLVEQINAHAPYYKPLSSREVERRTLAYFKTYTDSRDKMQGLNVKASIFGYMMQHLAIQGYYNPFTGEAQVNRFLPPFMLPFVVSHEMSHQAGIAAEGDANLLAYALCRKVDDKAFNYSGYFNIWLYTNARLRMVDSNLANNLRDQLNPLTRSHIDTLRAIRKRYRGSISEYSGALYDGYLKFHNQKDGLKSYNSVASSAWAWEQLHVRERDSLVRIP